MYGAILGDIIGSPYEFDRDSKTKEFPFFDKGARFTDDSVMTIAVAEALMDTMGKSDEEIRTAISDSMRLWGHRYPDAGYGGRFRGWLAHTDYKPYKSYGNGSAMRVSSAGWLFDTLEETRHMATLTAEVTHNHPEGIKGAQATAAAIWMARHDATKEGIKEYIMDKFGYDLNRDCDDIRPDYFFDVSCQGTVPEAIIAFLDSWDFESAIRLAVSLGGDSDTLTCITGGIAEAFYKEIPEHILAEMRNRLDADWWDIINGVKAVAAKHETNK